MYFAPVGCGSASGFVASVLFWSRNFGASVVTSVPGVASVSA